MVKNIEILEKLKKTNELVVVEINKFLVNNREDCDGLYDAIKYSTLSSGKRIRPYLVLEFAKLFGSTEEKALKYACAIEMLHASSLVHDDMPCMDNDDLRRGQPTTHKKYGENIALIAGDAMMYKAIELICSNSKVKTEFNLDAVHLLASLGGADGMLGGQFIDVSTENKSISFDELLELHSLKTGALMRTSALLGCLSCEMRLDDERAKDADSYAKSLGLAFQIVDDILDDGTEENKVNFLKFMSVEDAKEYASLEIKKAIAAIKKYNGAENLIELAEFVRDRQK